MPETKNEQFEDLEQAISNLKSLQKTENFVNNTIFMDCHFTLNIQKIYMNLPKSLNNIIFGVVKAQLKKDIEDEKIKIKTISKSFT